MARVMGTDLRSMGPIRQKELLLAATEANERGRTKSPKGADRGRSKSVRRPEVKKEVKKEAKNAGVFDWDDDQVAMALAAKARDQAARAKYEQERPVKREPKQENRDEGQEQKQLALESKKRNQRARVKYDDEVKERLIKANEYIREEGAKKDLRERAAAEKAEIQAKSARTKTERAVEQAAEKAKMNTLRADIKMERTAAAKAAPKNVWVKNESGKSPAYTKALEQADVVMRDATEVKKEANIIAKVQANKAAIDKQEKQQKPQAMEVDKPKGVGGYQLAQLGTPDNRSSYAEIGEGCLISGGHSLMYRSHTEPGAYAPSYNFNWQYPKSFAPCDSESDYDY